PPAANPFGFNVLYRVAPAGPIAPAPSPNLSPRRGGERGRGPHFQRRAPLVPRLGGWGCGRGRRRRGRHRRGRRCVRRGGGFGGFATLHDFHVVPHDAAADCTRDRMVTGIV